MAATAGKSPQAHIPYPSPIHTWSLVIAEPSGASAEGSCTTGPQVWQEREDRWGACCCLFVTQGTCPGITFLVRDLNLLVYKFLLIQGPLA